MDLVQHFDPSQQPLVKLTDAAIKHFQKTMHDNPGQFIVLDVKKTGCSGFSYATHLENSVNDQYLPITQEHKLPLYMTQRAMPLLRGITIDYESHALGQKGLRYINPNETGRCGCGESFTTDPKFLDEDSDHA